MDNSNPPPFPTMPHASPEPIVNNRQGRPGVTSPFQFPHPEDAHQAITPSFLPEPSPHEQSSPSSNDEKKPPMSKADYYGLIRARIENENELVNQRLIWMVFSQSFMFSGFAIMVNAPEKPKSPVMGAQQDLLLWIIPTVALLSSTLIYIGLLASLVSASGLRKLYDKYPPDNTVDYYPPLQNVNWIRWLSVLPPIILPLLFISTWVFMMLNQIIQAGRQP